MKTAQEFRTGQVLNLEGKAWVILRTEFNKSGRSSAVVKMKLKNLLTGASQEPVFKADDKIEPVILEKKDVTYSYYADPHYVFMDEEYNPIEVEAENLGDMINYIVDGMTDVCNAVFYEGKPISIELPTTIVRTVVYTEPAARGDTSGKVMKLGRLENGYELQVAAFIDTGESIEIDSRTGEFKCRAKT